MYIKVGYTSLPQPLVVTESIKSYLQRKMQNIEGPASGLEEEKEKIVNQVKAHLLRNDSLEEMSTCMEIDMGSLLKIMSPENRYVLSVTVE